MAVAQAGGAALRVLGGVRGAELRIDGELRGTLPLSAPVPVSPGSHQVEVSAPGYATTSSAVRLSPGQTLLHIVKLSLAPPGSTPAPAPKPAPRAAQSPPPKPAAAPAPVQSTPAPAAQAPQPPPASKPAPQATAAPPPRRQPPRSAPSPRATQERPERPGPRMRRAPSDATRADRPRTERAAGLPFSRSDAVFALDLLAGPTYSVFALGQRNIDENDIDDVRDRFDSGDLSVGAADIVDSISGWGMMTGVSGEFLVSVFSFGGRFTYSFFGDVELMTVDASAGLRFGTDVQFHVGAGLGVGVLYGVAQERIKHDSGLAMRFGIGVTLPLAERVSLGVGADIQPMVLGGGGINPGQIGDIGDDETPPVGVQVPLRAVLSFLL